MVGNTEVATSEDLHIDDTDPVTTSDIDRHGRTGPVDGHAQRRLTACSPASMRPTTASTAGHDTTYTAPFDVSGDGTHTVEYWSVDVVGNIESPRLRGPPHRRHRTR